MKLYVYQQDEHGQMHWVPTEVPHHIGCYLLWFGFNVVKAAC